MATIYASKAVTEEIQALMAQATGAGWTRPAVQAATGLTPAAQWRTTHKGNLRQDEVDTWREFLTKIESGELQPPAKAQGSGQGRVAQLEAEVAELRALVDQLLAAQA